MKTFADSQGRLWAININVDAIRRVKGSLGVNLLEAVDGKLLEQLSSDPILLCDVIYVLCQSEAEKLGVSDEEFGRAMAGDVIDQATTSLLEELVDFFPQVRRKLLGKALHKLRQLEASAAQLIDKRLDDPSLERKLLGTLTGSIDQSLTEIDSGS